MKFRSFVFPTAFLGLSALLLGAAAPAAAQDEDDLEARYGVLEEVVSTARKREEPLQETPVASTVLSGGELDRAFAPNRAAMPFLAPNVQPIQRPADLGFRITSIRGYTLTDVGLHFRPAGGHHGQRHLLLPPDHRTTGHVRRGANWRFYAARRAPYSDATPPPVPFNCAPSGPRTSLSPPARSRWGNTVNKTSAPR